ncbi:arylamine n-acetyltransferase 1 [Moniliophthora roreri]|nr:arylamine n-acetyltransferase 1 [Moniliophthora roreri]
MVSSGNQIVPPKEEQENWASICSSGMLRWARGLLIKLERGSGTLAARRFDASVKLRSWQALSHLEPAYNTSRISRMLPLLYK